MPVKWDARTDQILLLKILETSQVSADVKAISDAWPTSEAEKPTPRAITERLGKIRKDVKGGTGSFKVSGQKAAMLTSDVTPQKRAPRGSKSGSTPKKSNGGGNSINKAVNVNGKRARSGGEKNTSVDDELSPALSSDHDHNHDQNHNSNHDFSLPPADPSMNEDTFNVPTSKELCDMLIHYGIVARDDNEDDNRSQTVLPDVDDDENEERTPKGKKARKVKVEEGQEGNEENGIGFGAAGTHEDGQFDFASGGFGHDGAGDYPREEIFA